MLRLPGRSRGRAWRGWFDVIWILLWIVGLAGIVFRHWHTIAFHLIWITFALIYSFRIRHTWPTMLVLAAMVTTTFAAIGLDVRRGLQPTDELTEIPLMSAMFWIMMWHERRRIAANAERAAVSEENERLLATQRRFLQDASHQLKTHITIALGHSELLARSLADNQDKRDISVIVGELNRLRTLSERLLQIAASANLIRLSAIRDDQSGYAALMVQDTGSGIAPADLTHVFDRFATGSQPAGHHGTGLGLALVRAVAEGHGGHVRAHSTPGLGSRFELMLPLARRPDVMPSVTVNQCGSSQ